LTSEVSTQIVLALKAQIVNLQAITAF